MRRVGVFFSCALVLAACLGNDSTESSAADICASLERENSPEDALEHLESSRDGTDGASEAHELGVAIAERCGPLVAALRVAVSATGAAGDAAEAAEDAVEAAGAAAREAENAAEAATAAEAAAAAQAASEAAAEVSRRVEAELDDLYEMYPGSAPEVVELAAAAVCEDVDRAESEEAAWTAFQQAMSREIDGNGVDEHALISAVDERCGYIWDYRP